MTTPHPWLVTPARRPAAGTRLVCLPHAGGSASFYRRWAQHLDCDVELQIVQYPGREERVDEPFLTDPEALVEAVAGAVLETARPDVETVLFGHSMGALIGYETVRTLAARGLRVGRLFVSGQAAPDERIGREPATALSDDAILHEVETHGGTQMSIFDDPEIREMVLPILRNDYLLIDSYSPRTTPPVDASVIALAGDRDTSVSVARVRRWEGVAGKEFHLHTFPGGHFFLAEQRAQVITVLHQYLRTGA
ncbi:thioesterase [Streptomyces sp. WAC 06725]|uniref:thioesterase II family protein n=1 Tax=Streptomyces sp. WAC 06725 TaxID=2203209 RepID=UPI000F73A09B|nr:alpha/beta fold hydrolase [Streptomyces sp. WAC 06725]RSO46444.1 thioesterase [Streptomyces sp. WAC 06725]